MSADCLVEVDRNRVQTWAENALQRVKRERDANAKDLRAKHAEWVREYESKSWFGRLLSTKPGAVDQQYHLVGNGIALPSVWRRKVTMLHLDVERLANECLAAVVEGERVLLSAEACKKLRQWGGPPE